MDNDTREVLIAVDNIVERLSGKLLPSDIRHGWSDESRTAMLRHYQRIRTRIAQGEKLLDKDGSVGRQLDAWGIDGGLLENSLFGVSEMLRAQRSLFQSDSR